MMLVTQIEIDRSQQLQESHFVVDIKIVSKNYTNQTLYFYQNTDPYSKTKTCGMVFYFRFPTWGPFPEFYWVKQAYFDNDVKPPYLDFDLMPF